MVVRNDFAAFMERLLGDRVSSRTIGEAVGISHTAVADMRKGRVPSYRLLEKFATGMKLDPVQREALFRSAGYTLTMEQLDLDQVPDPVLSSLAETARQLKPEQRKLVLQLARGLAGSVKHPAAAGCA